MLVNKKPCGTKSGFIDYWAGTDPDYDPALSGWDMDDAGPNGPGFFYWRPWGSRPHIPTGSDGPDVFGDNRVLYAKIGSRGERGNVLMRSAPLIDEHREGLNEHREGFGQQHYLHATAPEYKYEMTPELFKKLKREHVIYKPAITKTPDTYPNDYLSNTPKVPVIRTYYSGNPGSPISIETGITDDFLRPNDSNFIIRTL